MKLIPSVRLLLLTAVSAALVAPSLCRKMDGLLDRARPSQATAVTGAAHDQGGAETSLVHGAAGGVVASGNARGKSPDGETWSPASPLDREFRGLLTTLHRASRYGSEGQSLWRGMTAFLTLSDPAQGRLREESLLDPEYGEFSLNSSFLEKSERRASQRGGDNPGADRFAVARQAFETRMLAVLNESASARPAPGSDSYLVPIYVHTDALDNAPGTAPDFSPGVIPAASTAPGIVPSPDWSSLASTSATVSGVSLTWNASALPAPAAQLPPAYPVWQNSTPSPAPTGYSGFPSHHFTSSTSSGSMVLTSPSVPAAQFVSRSIAPSVPASTSLSPVPAISSTVQAASTNAQPPTAPAQTIYVADTVADRVDEYNIASTITPTAGFTPISASNPTAVAVSLINNYLYVGDSGASNTVKAYSASTGAQISGTLFTPISVTNPTAIVLTSNGADMYVASAAGTVKEYNAATGALVTGMGSLSVSSPDPLSLLLSSNGADLFIGDAGNTMDGTNGTLKEYSTATGSLVATLISGNFYPGGLALSQNGSDIYVAEEFANVVKEYTTSGAPVTFSLSPAPGEPVNVTAYGPSLFVADAGGISGSGSQVELYGGSGSTLTPVGFFRNINGINPSSIAIPEPSSAPLLFASGAMLLFLRRRRTGAAA